MTIDVQGLRSTLRQLKEDVAVLHRRVEAVEQQLADASPADPGVQLPPEITVPKPAAVAAFLHGRPQLAEIVVDMAPALLAEFANEPSQVALEVYEDPEIEDYRHLVYYVRLPDYEDSIMDRLDRVAEAFEARTGESGEWVLITTDYHPMS